MHIRLGQRLTTNIRLGWMWLTVTNTLGYFGTTSSNKLVCFKRQRYSLPGPCAKKIFQSYCANYFVVCYDINPSIQ
jgi:hypothetical protein